MGCSLLNDYLKLAVISTIYAESKRNGKPVFGMVDDSVVSKTKPLSLDLHPIEAVYFHQSHLKGKQDYGYQAVTVLLACNGIVFNYTLVLYDKSISKIERVADIAKELPVPPVLSYFLCDSWYTSETLINVFAKKGFHTMGALKTNRILYSYGVKKKLCEFATMLAEKRSGFDLVTVKNQRYYVFCYEGKINGIENAVIFLTYPEKAFGNPKVLHGFISTDISLNTKEIIDSYVERWSIEVFFRQCKNTLALDSHQIRSAKGIQRYCLLMSLAYFICCIGIEKCIFFSDGYHTICMIIHKEKIQYIFQ